MKTPDWQGVFCLLESMGMWYTVLERKGEEMMFQQFYPDEYLDSAYDIDFKAFYDRGYRGVIFDIDNTLVPHDAPADERAADLFYHLHGLGYQTMLLSNNKEPRVKSFADAVDTGYLYKSGKPKRRGYRKAMENMGTDERTTLFVGDQLFTDVWGAKRSNIHSILVKPIHPKEEIQIVLKRYLEKIVLFFYSRDRKKEKGRHAG